MLRLVTTVDVLALLVILIASFFLSISPCAAAGAPPGGPVTGVIDAVRYEGDQFYVFGWACQQGNAARSTCISTQATPQAARRPGRS